MDSSGSGDDSLVGSCKRGKDPSGSIKGGHFID
jgi:hypothetical protein